MNTNFRESPMICILDSTVQEGLGVILAGGK